MDHRQETRDFLTSRRARLTPEQVGLPTYAELRRVPGLRRSEVALLAGVSVEYYTRIERGDLTGVSDGVLTALADALQLDASEQSHLTDLARAATARPTARPDLDPEPTLRPSTRAILDGLTTVPALVRNGRMDVLATNTVGRALYAPAFADPRRPVNLARFCFLDPAAVSLYADWPAFADANVALLRTEVGRAPTDPRLGDLVDELAARSEPFRSRWAAHQVLLHRSGPAHFRHPDVGDLALTFDTLDLPDHPGLTLKAYTATPGSATAQRLTMLAERTLTTAGGWS